MTRPRDALGRPLPPGDPRAVPGVPGDLRLSDEQAWQLICSHLDARRPFHAHEVAELRWRQAPAADRIAWRAVAQWGAALTHEARGNAVGARRLAQRAVGTLADAPHIPSAIDVTRIRQSCAPLGAS